MPGRLEEEAFLRVDELGLARRDPEEQGVEIRHAVQEPAPSAVGPAGSPRSRRIPLIGVPPITGHLRDEVGPGQQAGPQLVDVPSAGEAPGHTDDRDALLARPASLLPRHRRAGGRVRGGGIAEGIGVVRGQPLGQRPDIPMLVEQRRGLGSQTRLHGHPEAPHHERIDPQRLEGRVRVHGALGEPRGLLDKIHQPGERVTVGGSLVGSAVVLGAGVRHRRAPRVSAHELAEPRQVSCNRAKLRHGRCESRPHGVQPGPRRQRDQTGDLPQVVAPPVVEGDPAVLPDGPDERLRPAPATSGTRLLVPQVSEFTQRSVRRGVRRLARRTDVGTRRGEEREPLEGLVSRRLVERDSALDLGRPAPSEHVVVRTADEAGRRAAGQMEHVLQRPEPPGRLLDRGTHGHRVGQIRAGVAGPPAESL